MLWFRFVDDVELLLIKLIDLHCSGHRILAKATEAALLHGMAVHHVETASVKCGFQQALMMMLALHKYPQVLFKPIPLPVSIIIRCVGPVCASTRRGAAMVTVGVEAAARS